MKKENARVPNGPDKVYDFSLGNLEVEPPVSVKKALQNLVNSYEEGLHRYMSNAGYYDVRENCKLSLTGKNSPTDRDNIVKDMCGVVAGLNVVLKTILNLVKEVILFSPHFVEYIHYINNYDGKPITADSKDTLRT